MHAPAPPSPPTNAPPAAFPGTTAPPDAPAVAAIAAAPAPPPVAASSIPASTPALLPSAIPAPTARNRHTGSPIPADRRAVPGGSWHTAGLLPPSVSRTTTHPTTSGACGKPADGLQHPNAPAEFAAMAPGPDRMAAVAPLPRFVPLQPPLRSSPACSDPPLAAAILPPP